MCIVINCKWSFVYRVIILFLFLSPYVYFLLFVYVLLSYILYIIQYIPSVHNKFNIVNSVLTVYNILYNCYCTTELLLSNYILYLPD